MDSNPMDEILKEFLVESYENLDRLDRDLVALEKDPANTETLASIFRTIHTLKGGSGFLGLGKLEAVAHAGENLLSKLRDGVIVIDPELASALLATVDAVRFMLGRIEATGQPGERDFSEVIALLNRLNGGAGEAAAVPEDVGFEPELPPDEAKAPEPEPPPPGQEPPARTAEPEPPQAHEAPESRAPAVSDSTIRVDVGLLDKLMNLVGELVLARNQVLQYTAQQADGALPGDRPAAQPHHDRTAGQRDEDADAADRQRLEQASPGRARPRHVLRQAGPDRDGGQGDRAGQDHHRGDQGSADPYRPQLRRPRHSRRPRSGSSAAKPAEGCLKMRAYHEGGQVNIEITDDGGGIDIERVKQKALQRGLITRRAGCAR